MRRFPSWLIPSLALAAGVQQAGGQAGRGARRPTPPRPRRPPPGRPAGDRDGHLQPAQGPGGVREVLHARRHLPLVSSKQQEIGFTKARAHQVHQHARRQEADLLPPGRAVLQLDGRRSRRAWQTPGFKAVGDDLAKFATGGLLGMVAVETGDKGTAALPRARHGHLQHAQGHRRVRVLLLGDAPAAGGRRPGGDRVHPGGPDPVRVQPRRLGAGQVPPGRAVLQLDGRRSRRASPRRRSRRWATTSAKFATGGLTALIGEQQ